MIPLFFVSLVVTFIFVKRFNLSTAQWFGLLGIVLAFEILNLVVKVLGQEAKRSGQWEVRK